MINVDDWAEIRRLHRAEGMGIKAIGRRLGVACNTVRTALRADGPPRYERKVKGSLVDAVEPDVLALLREFPLMPATVIAERIGWTNSIRVLRDRVAELRPLFAPAAHRAALRCRRGPQPCATPCAGRCRSSLPSLLPSRVADREDRDPGMSDVRVRRSPASYEPHHGDTLTLAPRSEAKPRTTGRRFGSHTSGSRLSSGVSPSRSSDSRNDGQTPDSRGGCSATLVPTNVKSLVSVRVTRGFCTEFVVWRILCAAGIAGLVRRKPG